MHCIAGSDASGGVLRLERPRLQFGFPVTGQRSEVGHPLQQIGITSLAEEEPANVGYGDSIGIAIQDFNLLSGTNFPWLEHREVKATSAAPQKAFDDVITLESKCQLVARNARLRNDEDGIPGAQGVTDTKTVLGQPECGEILAKRAHGKDMPGSCLRQ